MIRTMMPTDDRRVKALVLGVLSVEGGMPMTIAMR